MAMAAIPVRSWWFRERRGPRPAAGGEAGDAVEPGPCAPHRIRDFPALDVVPLVGGEGGDFLTLNVWAPGQADGPPVILGFMLIPAGLFF